MVNTTDILLDDSTLDLKIVDGDFVVDDGTAQHQQCLLLAAKGDYKQFPLLGVDVWNEINNERPEDVMREIRLQFTQDGMKIKKAEFNNNKINIDAQY